MKKLVPLIVILFYCLSARADYHYASHEGSNEYPYTSWETGALIIQDAVDAAEPGDTVFVGEGVWSDTTTNWTDLIGIIGMGMGNTILENYELTPITNYGDTVIIEGFSFVSDWRNLALHSGISCRSLKYVVIKNNYFFGNARGVSGNISGQIVNNIFERNMGAMRTTAIKNDLVFEHNTVINDGWGSSFLCDDLLPDSGKFYIRKNLFYEGIGQFRVFFLGPAYPADTIFIHNNVFSKKKDLHGVVHAPFGYSGNLTYFYNNTIDGRSEDIEGAIITGIESNLIMESDRTIDNNIIMNCEVAVYNERSYPARMRYNDIYSVDRLFDGAGELVEGNIFDNPMFMDTLDYHLQAFSPAIDAGDPQKLDVDGSRSDMGTFGGPNGESYEYFDLPPGRPDSLQAEVSAGLDTIYLYWLCNTEADFNRYQVHRDTVSDFEPTIFNMIAEPETSLYIDFDWTPEHDYYYLVSAVDNQDNLSDYSDELAVIFTDIDDNFDMNMPRVAVLSQNYPNPFNLNTIIEYYLPDIGYQPAQVRLLIYDMLGRQVRTLVNEPQYPGEYRVVWNGRDDNGIRLPTGVYFSRLFISKAELTRPKKLILMR